MEQRSMVAPLVLVPTRHERLRATVSGRWESVGQKWLATAALILLDVSVALLLWEVADLLLRSIWDLGATAGGAVAVLAPGLAGWVVVCALLGLYPWGGLDWVEQLRRHTYHTLVAATIIVVFAVSLHATYPFPRLLVLLIIVSLGLLVLSPLLQYCAKALMRKAGLWGKPV